MCAKIGQDESQIVINENNTFSHINKSNKP